MVRAATRLACVLALPPPPRPGRLWLCVLTLCVCVHVHVRVEWGGSQSVKVCTVTQGLEALPLAALGAWV